MAVVTIPCPNCGKSHRAAGFAEASSKCLERAEKAAAREAAKAADLERREQNWKREKPWEMVWRLRRDGRQWDHIPKQLRDTYVPPAEGQDWTLYDVVKMDSVRLLATWPADLETITLIRLEKIHSGEYLTIHPLSLDGTFSMAADGGRNVQLEIPWTDQQLKDADKRRRADAKREQLRAEAEAAREVA